MFFQLRIYKASFLINSFGDMVGQSRNWQLHALGGVMGTGKSDWEIEQCLGNVPFLAFRPANSVRGSDEPPKDKGRFRYYTEKIPGVTGVGTITSRGRKTKSIDALLIDPSNPHAIIQAVSSGPDYRRLRSVGIDEAHMFPNVNGLINVINHLGATGIQTYVVTLETDFGGVPFPIVSYLRDHGLMNEAGRRRDCENCHSGIAIYNQAVDTHGDPIPYTLLGNILVGDNKSEGLTSQETQYLSVCANCYQVPEGSPLHPSFDPTDFKFEGRNPLDLNPWELVALAAYKSRPGGTL